MNRRNRYLRLPISFGVLLLAASRRIILIQQEIETKSKRRTRITISRVNLNAENYLILRSASETERIGDVARNMRS